MMINDFKLVAVVIFTLFGSIYFFVYGFKWLSRKRLIENTPTSKIRSLAIGLVEVYGKVVPRKEIFKAPLSKKDCVYYKYCIEEERSSGKSSTWVTIDQDEKRSPFYLKDETGVVLVDSDGAQIELLPDVNIGSGWRQDPPEDIKSFLKSRGLGYKGLLGNKNMRFTEWNLSPGDKVYVMGTASDNKLASKNIVRKDAEDIVITQGEQEKFCYISDRPEKAVLDSFRRRSLLIVVGGIIIVIDVIMICFFTNLG